MTCDRLLVQTDRGIRKVTALERVAMLATLAPIFLIAQLIVRIFVRRMRR